MHRYDLELLGESPTGGVEARHYDFHREGDEQALAYAHQLGEHDFARVVDFELCREVRVAPGERMPSGHITPTGDYVWECPHPMGDEHEDLFCEALRARGEVVLRVTEEREGGAILEITQDGRGAEASN